MSDIHPVTGDQLPVLAIHHVESVMAAVDSGATEPNPNDPLFTIQNSYIPNPQDDVGRLSSEFGLSSIVKSLVQSLPLKNDAEMNDLLFTHSNRNELSDSQVKMVDSIFEENMRQEQNIQIQPKPLPGITLEEAIGPEDNLTPADADEQLKPSWSGLRSRP